MCDWLETNHPDSPLMMSLLSRYRAIIQFCHRTQLFYAYAVSCAIAFRDVTHYDQYIVCCVLIEGALPKVGGGLESSIAHASACIIACIIMRPQTATDMVADDIRLPGTQRQTRTMAKHGSCNTNPNGSRPHCGDAHFSVLSKALAG